MIQIQYQDKSGVWRTSSSTLNNSQRILQAMQSASRSHPGCRIRAVNASGQVVDMLVI